MYAPICTRLDTYSIPLDPVSQEYVATMLGLPAFQEWREAALQEAWTVAHDEVDETPTDVFRKVA
jgi:glutathione S-transferase